MIPQTGDLQKRIIVWLCGLCVTLVAASAAQSQKPTSTCKRAFKQQKYLVAAQCFERIADVIGSQSPKGIKLLKLDGALRAAAFSYIRAAKKTPSTEAKGYLRQRAAILLMRSFRAGSCQATNRCRAHRMLADRLNRQIQYTPLVIITGVPKARIAIEGYKYRTQHQHNFSGSLRPGTYTITVLYPKKQKPKIKRVVLRPAQPVTVNVTPFRIRVVVKREHVERKIPTWIWLGYVIGGSLATASTIMVIYSATEQDRLNAINVDPVANQQLTVKAYNERFDTAQGVKVFGISMGALGLAVLASGVIVHIVYNSRNPRPQAPPTSPSLTPTRLLSASPIVRMVVGP